MHDLRVESGQGSASGQPGGMVRSLKRRSTHRRSNVSDEGWECMRTVDLARAVGLSTQQVRDYEAQGLLPRVERSRSGYRLYADHHLEALRTVRTMRSAGYTGHQVREIMRAVHRGDADTALALIDARHAQIDRQRKQVQLTLDAIGALSSGSTPLQHFRHSDPLLVGKAARAAGVRQSALRFWEQEGLLQPKRDQRSGYRLYDQRQMRRLEIIVHLRAASYTFDAVRSVLGELAAGRPESTLRAIEQRRTEIAAASLACAEATACVWRSIRDQRR